MSPGDGTELAPQGNDEAQDVQRCKMGFHDTRGTGSIDEVFDTVSGGAGSRAEQGKDQMNSVDVNDGSGPIPLTCCETDPYTESRVGTFAPDGRA
jgi:hypothetical protein